MSLAHRGLAGQGSPAAMRGFHAPRAAPVTPGAGNEPAVDCDTARPARLLPCHRRIMAHGLGGPGVTRL